MKHPNRLLKFKDKDDEFNHEYLTYIFIRNFMTDINLRGKNNEKTRTR